MVVPIREREREREGGNIPNVREVEQPGNPCNQESERTFGRGRG
jgi:hypothetical protein